MNDTIDQHFETLYVTDAEMIRRMGVPEKIARQRIRALDAKHLTNGFPQKQELWGDRRHWPSVKQWLERQSAPRMGVSQRETRRAG